MELLSQERAGGNKCETGQNEQDLVHAQVERDRDQTIGGDRRKPVATDDKLGLHEVPDMDTELQRNTYLEPIPVQALPACLQFVARPAQKVSGWLTDGQDWRTGRSDDRQRI